MKKIILIGHGNIAKDYIKVFNHRKKIKIIAVLGRNKNNVKNFAEKNNISKYFHKIDDIKLIKNFDAFIVAIPILETIKVLSKIAKYKKTVFFEKPMGVNYKESKRIYDVFQNSKTNLYMLLNRRNYFVTKYAITKLQNDKSKRIIRITDQQDTFGNLLHSKVYKNIQYTNSIHLIDYINLFARGKIKKIIKNPLNSLNKKTFNCYLIFSSGDIVFYECFFNIKMKWQVNIINKDKNIEFKPLEKIYINNIDNTKKADIKNLDTLFKPGFFNSVKEIEAKLNNKKCSLPNLKDSLNVMKLIKSIYD